MLSTRSQETFIVRLYRSNFALSDPSLRAGMRTVNFDSEEVGSGLISLILISEHKVDYK